MTIRGRNVRLEGVIPLAMKSVSDDVKSFEFRIADLNTRRIDVGVLDGRDHQSLLSRRMGDKFNHRLKRNQRLGTPVDGDVGEEPMFDFVPFAGAGRKMTDRDA